MSGGGAAGRPPADAGWGAYCLANDAVLDWTLALLESLRRFAPRLELRVIPFDDRQERLGPELERRGHAYWHDAEVERLDRLGRRFYPGDEFAARGFRKLAAFSGPFERFLFLDSDVLVLAPLDELGAAFAASGGDVLHFDTDVEQVYRPGPLRDEIVARGRGRGFNAGLFGGRRGVLDSGRLERALADLDDRWAERLVPNAEQPFFNLFADRAGLELRAAHELVPDVCSTCWPSVGRLEFDGAAYRLRDSGRWDEGWRFLLAHWAGHKLSPAMPNRALWESFRAAAGKW